MRQIQATDIFALARVLNAIGIKEEVKKVAMQANSIQDLSESDIGFDFIFSIFEKATQKKAEKELFEFFANIFEEDVETVKKLDPVDFIDRILEAADVEKWKAFFSRAVKLMK